MRKRNVLFLSMIILLVCLIVSLGIGCNDGEGCEDVENCEDEWECSNEFCSTLTGKCSYNYDGCSCEGVDCDDGIDCTKDYCQDGECFTVDDCPEGEYCLEDTVGSSEFGASNNNKKCKKPTSCAEMGRTSCLPAQAGAGVDAASCNEDKCEKKYCKKVPRSNPAIHCFFNGKGGYKCPPETCGTTPCSCTVSSTPPGESN